SSNISYYGSVIRRIVCRIFFIATLFSFLYLCPSLTHTLSLSLSLSLCVPRLRVDCRHWYPSASWPSVSLVLVFLSGVESLLCFLIKRRRGPASAPCCSTGER